MTRFVHLSVTSAFRLLLAACSFLFVQNSRAQCPPVIVSGGVTFVALNGGLPFAGNNHCYYISTTGGDLGNGQFRGSQIASAVAGTGGYAATLHTAAENAFVANALLAYHGSKAPGEAWGDPRNAWIGFTDAAPNTEGQFVWSSGEPICYTNWNVAEPNDFAIGEDFTEMLIMDAYPYGGGTNDPFGKWNDWYNDNVPAGLPGAGPTRLPIVLEVGSLVTNCGNQGCSLGFWKNHTSDWEVYTTSQTLESVFDVPDALGYDNTTLLQALNFTGGAGVQGGARNLLRQAVAALLNAAHSGVDYPLTVAQVISQVNTALATMNRNAMLTLAGTLDGYNNLHGASLCSDDVTSRNIGSGVGNLAVDGEKVFAISGYPNPSRSNFTIQIDGASSEDITVRVTDMTGRLVEQRTNLAANKVVQIGNNYSAGMYYVEVIQGAARKQIKLIKQ